MSDASKNLLVEAVLERAAEHIGDITGPVMAAYYERFPEARAMFEHHGRLRSQTLEGEMVEQALYCLMHWFTSPGEVEIVLLGSVPHHNDTLSVPPEAYRGLLQATAEIIGTTIPADRVLEQAAWRQLVDELTAVIDQGSGYITRPVDMQAGLTH